MRLATILFVFLFGTAVAGGWLAVEGWRALNRPLALPREGLMLLVEPGTSLQVLATRLARERVLDSPLALAVHGRVSGKAAKIRAGEYLLQPGTTARDLLDQLVAGRVHLHAFTIIEGWTLRDLLRALREHAAVRSTLPLDTEVDLASLIDLPTPMAEGWFFPDTYLIPRGITDVDVLLLAHRRMRDVLGRIWTARAGGLPFDDPYQALVLASIVEKETGVDEERERISGVFVRRLRAGMRLQTDPSVIYGLGVAFDGNLTRQQLQADGPYNTYLRGGLPPTPICLPGERSLLAAVRPAGGDALYFVASGAGDGRHVFSATLDAHNAAVRRYLQAQRGRKP